MGSKNSQFNENSAYNEEMKTFTKILLWWFVFSAVWGLFRLTHPNEVTSELLAKPLIWLGITAIAFKLKLLPNSILKELQAKYLQVKPITSVFILPVAFVIFYFFLIYFRRVSLPEMELAGVLLSLLINFSTGIVEEIVYRGVLYTWLLKQKSEVVAFTLVQVLFLLGHLPTILLNSETLVQGLTRGFFIVLIGSVLTLIYRVTRSLYSSAVSHGVWNSLVHLLLLG